MTKIFVFAMPSGWGTNLICSALSEEGVVVANHVSSNDSWAKHDMGIRGECKHAEYDKHYPEGWELEWIDFDDLDGHDEFQKAFKLNQAEKAVESWCWCRDCSRW